VDPFPIRAGSIKGSTERAQRVPAEKPSIFGHNVISKVKEEE
jgi:hypothetical protein